MRSLARAKDLKAEGVNRDGERDGLGADNSWRILSRLRGSGSELSSEYSYPLGYIPWSIRFCSKSLSYADDRLALEEMLVGLVDCVRRLEELSELIFRSVVRGRY